MQPDFNVRAERDLGERHRIGAERRSERLGDCDVAVSTLILVFGTSSSTSIYPARVSSDVHRQPALRFREIATAA